MRIRIFITLMVAAIMLPLVLASAFAVNKIWRKEQAAALASLHKTVDATSLMVERDIHASIAALYALAFVSDVFVGPRSRRQLIAVYVPAGASGANNYVVVQGFALEHWKNIAQQQDIPADWIVAVFDRAGKASTRTWSSRWTPTI